MQSSSAYTGIKILMIDDDLEFCTLMKDFLEMNSFCLTSVQRGLEGLQKISESDYEIVLLDIFLPDINGIDVLRLIRKKSSIPVVMLSAHNEETDRIIALEIGADDYVPKTFSARELLAHIRAVLRRHSAVASPDITQESSVPSEGENLEIRGLRICNRTKNVTLDGVPLTLTASEFQILYVLMHEAGKVFSREDLLSVIADRDFNKFDRSIDVHISSLRHKLKDDSNSPKYIRTFRGLGYSFIQ